MRSHRTRTNPRFGQKQDEQRGDKHTGGSLQKFDEAQDKEGAGMSGGHGTARAACVGWNGHPSNEAVTGRSVPCWQRENTIYTENTTMTSQDSDVSTVSKVSGGL